jgi:hypothetical protein
MVQLLAAATARQEIVALIDALDMLDVPSAEAAGVDLRRLLWIRGHITTSPGQCRDRNERALDQAIKALTLVLQAGNFGVVAFDAAEAPAHALERLPFTTWRRLQRIIEGRQTTCVLVGGVHIARSAGGISMKLERAGDGLRGNGRLFTGFDLDVEVILPHAQRRDNVRLSISTHSAD